MKYFVLVLASIIISTFAMADDFSVLSVTKSLYPLKITTVKLTPVPSENLSFESYSVTATANFRDECAVPRENEIFKVSERSDDNTQIKYLAYSSSDLACEHWIIPPSGGVTKTIDLGVVYSKASPIITVNGVKGQ